MRGPRKPSRALCWFVLCIAFLEGAGRWVWWHKAKRAFDLTQQHGQELLRNDLINFMKVPSGLYSYTLKPGFAQGGLVVNRQGFAQRDEVPVERTPGKPRVAALGESTTQGNNVDIGNYPAHLRRVLAARAPGYEDVEVINAGVSGWFSDQAALRAENELAAFRPDIAILFVGWVDFIAYDPLGGIPKASIFDTHLHGSQFHLQAASLAKSVALLSNYTNRHFPLDEPRSVPIRAEDALPADVYRYFLKNLDRMVTAFRRANPAVRIALCTLVGRWPQMSSEDFATDWGRTNWMKYHALTPVEAADRLEQFNALIRTFAAEHGLLLFDNAADFAQLDRARLQWDFCHMHPEGNELLAENMYETLRQAGWVQGENSPRRDELRTKYRLAANEPPSR